MNREKLVEEITKRINLYQNSLDSWKRKKCNMGILQASVQGQVDALQEVLNLIKEMYENE